LFSVGPLEDGVDLVEDFFCFLAVLMVETFIENFAIATSISLYISCAASLYLEISYFQKTIYIVRIQGCRETW
jgi:hypothetical protein